MKILRSLIIALPVVCITLNLKAQDTTWSLQRCVEYARSHNIQVKQSELQKRMDALSLKQSQLSQIPNVNGSTNFGYNFGRSIDPTTNQFISQQIHSLGANLSVSENLFSWFRTRNIIAANKYALAASQASVEKLRNDISLNVATAYLNILQSNEQLRAADKQVDLTQHQLDNTKQLVQAGSVPESNQADLEAQLARDSSTYVQAKNSSILAVLQMKALLNLGFEVPFTVQKIPNLEDIPLLNLNTTTPAEIYAEAVHEQPQQQADSLNVLSAGKNLKAAKSGLYPSLSMFGSLATNFANSQQQPIGDPIIQKQQIGTVDLNGSSYDVYTQYPNYTYETIPFGRQLNTNFRQSVGISLDIPIFNGWQNNLAVQQSKVNLENQQLVQEQNKLTLKQNIYQSFADARAALEIYAAAKKTLDASRTAYDYAQQRYQLGLINSVDYLTSQNNQFSAEISMINARYDFIFKVKLLEFYRDQKIQF